MKSSYRMVFGSEMNAFARWVAWGLIWISPGMLAPVPLLSAAVNLPSDLSGGTEAAPPPEAFARQVPTPALRRPVVPAFAAPSREIRLSAAASDQELMTARVSEEPLAPLPGASDPADNAALAQALRTFSQAPKNAQPVADYLSAHGNSRWRASLQLNLGLVYRDSGYWSKAISSFTDAWQLTRDSQDLRLKMIADRALGELAGLYARFGRQEDLQTLLSSIVTRKVQGPATALLSAAQLRLGFMKVSPHKIFRCGPLSLSAVYLALHPGTAIPAPVGNLKSTPQGTNLAQLDDLARQIGLDYQLAVRAPGAAVLWPMIVHWKVGHFTAITGPTEGGFVSHDPTAGGAMTITPAVLDDEASGYCLVPGGSLPAGWRAATKEEAAEIYGRGDDPTPPHAPSPEDSVYAKDGCGGKGMATYNMEMASVCLTLSDTPVSYAPAWGPVVAFTANYNHREAASVTNISNLGPKWSFAWSNYLTAPTSATAIGFGPGGGQTNYAGFNPGTGSFNPQLLNQDQLVRNSATTYILYHRDGSREIFGLAETGANPRIFRTQSIDSAGNRILFNYDANYRLRTVVDAVGQTTVLEYGLSADPTHPNFFKITKVIDPFGRNATFEYNEAGQLAKITDVIGLSSQFAYADEDFIESLTTPYGTTRFTRSDTDQNRWIEATDPSGGTERIEWARQTDAIAPTTDPATVPAGFTNNFLHFRNTFYWDKKAMAEAPRDYTRARITHWLHLSPDAMTEGSTLIESTKEPFENRVWNAYPGQTNPIAGGTSNKPVKVARKLDDGTEQVYLYGYNTVGNVLRSVDPLGREMSYIYAANGIDVVAVRQKRGTEFETLQSFTYNSQHRPLTATDASGQVTTYTYTAVGQVETITNPKNEVTTFAYGTDAAQLDYGRVKSVTGPVAGATVRYTYDAFGRVRTTTDSEGYTVTFDYDAFDRPLKTTYSDGTYTQLLYNRLDVEWMRDRLGRWTHDLRDVNRRLVMRTDPMQRKTRYDWCTCGSLNALIDPAGQVTSWERDVQGRVTAKVYPDGTRETLTYEATTSRLKKRTDGRGQVTNYTYYKDNTVAALTYTDTAGVPLVPATPGVTYAYDPVYPRLTSMTDGVGTTRYTYNPIPPAPITTPVTGAGRLATIDGPLSNDTIAYNYDALGRQLSASINGAANTMAVTYDALGRVATQTNALGTFAYNYVGVTSRLDHLDYPSGQRANFAYYPNTAAAGTGNGDQRLRQIQHLKPGGSVLSTFTYTYDPVGQIQSWAQQTDAGAALTSTYRYDAAGQLIGAIIPSSGSVSRGYVYGYDLAGNRTEEQIDAGVTTSRYNNLNQLTGQSAGGKMSFSGTVNEPSAVSLAGTPASVDTSNRWRGQASVSPGANAIPLVATDVNGNVTSKTINITVASGGARTLSYDLAGNLVDDGAGKTYGWDALSRLVKITQGANVTEFVYDGNGRRVQEKLNGTLIKQWIWCDGPQPCEERDAAGNVTKRFYSGLGEQIGGTNYFLSTDHLGSVREMTDSTGAVRARYAYDPYGRISKISGDLEADFGFTGFYRHQASGLSLTLYRAYDPELGRWMSRDPIGENGGVNLYDYVLNKILSSIDPFGLKGTIEGRVDFTTRDANVITDGKGGFKPRVPNHMLAVDSIIFNSIELHEKEHIRQALRQNPRLGSDIKEYGRLLGNDNVSEKNRWERDAYNIQIRYLEEQLKSENLTEKRRKEIEDFTNDIRIKKDVYDKLCN